MFSGTQVTVECNIISLEEKFKYSILCTKSNNKTYSQSMETIDLNNGSAKYNSTNTSKEGSIKSIKEFLFWPDNNQLKQSKRTKTKIKIPPIVSGAQWQNIIQIKENEKNEKTKTAALKKKLRLEKKEKSKIQKEERRIKQMEQQFLKEQTRIKKEKEKFLREQIRINKENEKLSKHKERVVELEQKNKIKENMLLKQRKQEEINKQIEDLQKKQAALQNEC